MKKNSLKGLLIIGSIIVALIFSRLIPHLPNYTPIGAATLFGAAYFGRKYLAFLVPIAALYLSDFIINNTMYANYFDGIAWFSTFQVFTFSAMIVTALLGIALLKKVTILKVFSGAIAASLLFFVITNFGAWIEPLSIYPKTIVGLLAAYTAGLPFLLSTILSNLLFSALAFGGYEYYLASQPKFSTQEEIA